MITVLIVLLCLLILAILAAAMYYAAHYVVNLRHDRDTRADELKRAADHVADLEATILSLESQLDRQALRERHTPEDRTGWGEFNIRS